MNHVFKGHESHYERLSRRRREVLRTLAHLRQEQRTVDDNEDWLDRAAYESRVDLLDNMIVWYLNETERIDDALKRLAEGRYGVCLACREPIDSQRLASAPEAAFCAECQKTREALAHP